MAYDANPTPRLLIMPSHSTNPAELVSLLERAVLDNDPESVKELIAAGADPSLCQPDIELPSPIWLALKGGRHNLVAPLLAGRPRTIPVAYQFPKTVTVFEKLGAVSAGDIDHQSAYSALAESLDFSTAAMRAAAWKTFHASRDHLYGLSGDIEASRVAMGLIMFKATPGKMASVTSALNYPIVTMENWQDPAPFASYLIRYRQADGLFAHWFARGLSPDTVAGKLPLLHYTAMNGNVSVAQALLLAGANPRARGKSDAATRLLARANMPIAADGECTALELAYASGMNEVAKAILASSALGAVEQILAQARQRNSDNGPGTGGGNLSLIQTSTFR